MTDYSYLKPLFGENGALALTYDQFTSALKDSKTVKIGNLSGGEYVATGKYDAVVAERDALKTSKAEADAKLVGYEPDWKDKVASAQKEAESKVQEVLLRAAAVDALRTAGCKDPALIYTTLDSSKLKLEGDKLTGIDEQIEASKKARPFAYETGTGHVQVTTGSHAKADTGAGGDLDALYANNPYYRKRI
ncbi:MAG: phage scaffolding protein [Faecalibacterium sp.]